MRTTRATAAPPPRGRDAVMAAILDAAGERAIRAIMPTVRVDGDQAYLETT